MIKQSVSTKNTKSKQALKLSFRLSLKSKGSFMNKKNLLGIVLVSLGACSYGVLATFVKMAYQDDFTTNEITSSQYLIGLTVIGILTLFTKDKKKKQNKKSIIHLISAGTSLGLTGIFYYLSVKYIPVSIAIVLLMQSTWLGVVAE